MKTNLDVVDELYNTLNNLRPLKPEDKKRLDKKFRLEFNYNSNHIEGNTLTYGETELLLIFDDTLGKHQMREYEETKAHDLAYHMIEEWATQNERPLTEQTIKELNEIILVRPYWKDAITPDGQNTRRQIKVGKYKEYPNSVRLQNGEMFDYASPTETPILMEELIQWYRDEESVLHPVILATMLHYKFVRIHPFDDGNGRISRLLMNYVLLKNGYPPVIIKSADKDNYLRALHQADIGEYEPLIDYIAEQAIWSLETSLKAAKGESLEDTDDFKKEIELIKRKASTKGTPKSPLIIYDTFKLFSKEVWTKILNILDNFDGLFNEIKNVRTVNDWNEEYETKYISIFNSPGLGQKEISNKPEEFKIFGHDIYGTDIRKINYEHKMYGLRGSNIPIDLTINVGVIFHHYHYQISVNHNLYQLDKSYKEDFLPSEVDEINDTIKKYLLEYIKEIIN